MWGKNVFVIRREVRSPRGIPDYLALESVRLLSMLSEAGVNVEIIDTWQNNADRYYYTFLVDITDKPVVLRWIYRRRIRKIISEVIQS